VQTTFQPSVSPLPPEAHALFTAWCEAERIALDAERRLHARTFGAKRTGDLPTFGDQEEARSLRALAQSLQQEIFAMRGNTPLA